MSCTRTNPSRSKTRGYWKLFSTAEAPPASWRNVTKLICESAHLLLLPCWNIPSRHGCRVIRHRWGPTWYPPVTGGQAPGSSSYSAKPAADASSELSLPSIARCRSSLQAQTSISRSLEVSSLPLSLYSYMSIAIMEWRTIFTASMLEMNL